MQGHISLSKTEKQYQFFYLILMLLVALIFLGIVFLKDFQSPFSDEDIISIQKLDEKAKFDQKQKYSFKIMDSTYNQIKHITSEMPEAFVETKITYGINDLVNYYNTGDVPVIDIRKDAYPQIALFYKMYFDDKKTIATVTEDTEKFKKQFEDCSIGFREKKNQLFQRNNELKARTQ
ncbi:type VI secretion system TssO [Chryseobacterium sp. S-02]|uniref:type VI secretion system TssO n=1 Tax=Chryseobacterium sp. S-02 TaxID=3404064 RepID=UPI003CF53488